MATISLLLAGCSTLKDIQSSNAARTMGSFQLNPVQPNNCWHNGTTYEYNAYEIKITSKPVNAKIRWDGKYVGTTPLVYKFTGTVEKNDRITVQAIPLDENLRAQEAVLKIQDELPREIRLILDKK